MWNEHDTTEWNYFELKHQFEYLGRYNPRLNTEINGLINCTTSSMNYTNFNYKPNLVKVINKIGQEISSQYGYAPKSKVIYQRGLDTKS